jgi:hypothetical protein
MTMAEIISGFNVVVYLFVFVFLPEGSMSSCKHGNNKIPAFPGAEGGGKYTTGGRGGIVLKVTNLNDGGAGSLREALETKSRRTIVFDIDGNIELKKPILITYGDLTIAGQTAPGDGICIKGHEVRINADNIIIRFIRFRPGDESAKEYDAITGTGNENIIIDHCSMSWSVDETVSFYDNKNFTLQWSIISESLHNSYHGKGPHGYGGIWGGNNASFLYNILAHHNSRNPRLQGNRYNPPGEKEKVEFINNIIYNWGNKAMYGGEKGCYNIINNIFIPGPASPLSSRNEILEPYPPYGQFFLCGNVIHTNNSREKADLGYVAIPEEKASLLKAGKPFFFPHDVPIMDTDDAYDALLTFAGASLARDAADARVIRDIREKTYTYGNSGIIDSQEDVGGWPQLVSGSPLTDSDGDGIPDSWELLHALDPMDHTDANAYSIDGQYTNLEIYMNDIIDQTETITPIWQQQENH